MSWLVYRGGKYHGPCAIGPRDGPGAVWERILSRETLERFPMRGGVFGMLSPVVLDTFGRLVVERLERQ